MSDYEEDSIDVQSFSNLSSANSLGGAYRAEATHQWTTVSRVTAKKKNPPLFDVSISWFKSKELIDDWMNLTQLEAGTRGPELMNGLVGDASMYKKLLDRKPITSEDGVKYFMDTLKTHFTRGVQSVVRRRCFFYLFRGRRENMEMVKWIEKHSITPQVFEGVLDGHLTNNRQISSSVK